MPAFELHADYDHDGRLSTKQSEYERRGRMPGVIVVPNLDSDDRQLPAAITTGSQVKLDADKATKSGQDNELIPLRIKKVVEPPFGCSALVLKITGPEADKIRLYDRQGHRLPALSESPNEFELTLPENNILELKLEATNFPGTPLDSPSGLSTSFDGVNKTTNVITLELICLDVLHRPSIEDTAILTIAPILFANNSEPLEQLFMCSVRENQASLKDVQSALGVIGQSHILKIIPEDVSEDAWAQDQFEVGYTYSPGGLLNVIVHMPRMISNAVESEDTSNLAPLIASHFPSKNIALFDDFWERTFDVTDITGKIHSIAFKDTKPFSLLLSRLFSVRKTLLFIIGIIDKNKAQELETPFETFSKSREELPNLLNEAKKVVDKKKKEIPKKEEELEDIKHALELQVKQVTDTIIYDIFSYRTEPQIEVRIQGGLKLILSVEEFDRLSFRVFQMHSPSNFGGNIEVSVPTADAPFGKIIIGNVKFKSGMTMMDPDLLQFFHSQVELGGQPIVEINTSWLDVGHTDEVLIFVPHHQNEKGAAILRASPKKALEILNEATAFYIRGLPETHPHKIKMGIDPSILKFERFMKRGTTPVTHMFRGQYWLHHHPVNGIKPIEPPRIYRKMAHKYSFGLAAHNIPIKYGEGEDRFYHSGMNILEFLIFEEGTNLGIEDEFLKDIDKTLNKEFRDIPIIPLPVLFDTVNNLAEEETTAVTPNLVNMQVVGEHLFIPKPFGPRMKIQDAIDVLRQVLGKTEGARLTEQFIRSRKLDRTTVWIDAPVISNTHPLNDVDSAIDIAKQFQDGFPELELEEIADRIFKANPTQFTTKRIKEAPKIDTGPLIIIEDETKEPARPTLKREIKKGWRRLTIPENTVDLFEAYTEAVVSPLGLKTHWIDTWYYHVRFGELHCGTNTIRRPNVKLQKAWWNVKTNQTKVERH